MKDKESEKSAGSATKEGGTSTDAPSSEPVEATNTEEGKEESTGEKAEDDQEKEKDIEAGIKLSRANLNTWLI